MKTKTISSALLSGALSLSLIASANNNPAKKSNPVIETKINETKPEDIINKYIQAIGGKDNIDKVKTIHSTGNANVQDHSMTYESRQMAPNKMSVSISMNGSVLSKQVFNGTTGYGEQMGNKTDYTPDQIKPFAENKSLFPQENYITDGYKLELKGIEKVNDKPAYKIDVTSPSGEKSTQYYDSVSYLLLRSDAEKSGMNVTSVMENYKAVDNVLIPYKVTQTISTPNGDITVEAISDSIVINGNDVTDADFK